MAREPRSMRLSLSFEREKEARRRLRDCEADDDRSDDEKEMGSRNNNQKENKTKKKKRRPSSRLRSSLRLSREYAVMLVRCSRKMHKALLHTRWKRTKNEKETPPAVCSFGDSPNRSDDPMIFVFVSMCKKKPVFREQGRVRIARLRLRLPTAGGSSPNAQHTRRPLFFLSAALILLLSRERTPRRHNPDDFSISSRRTRKQSIR